MDTFYDPIRKLEGIKELNTVLDGKGGKLVSISGCIDTQKVHLASAIASDYNFLLIVSSDEVKARKIAEDAAFFNENVSYYPAKDAIFYNADISGKQIVGQRIEVINKIINEDKLTIVTTIDALSDTLIPIEKYIDSTLVFKTDDVLDLDKIKSKLVAIGYERMPMVEGRGQFSIRGGIIDIFPFTSETPVRIELWDDEIDSIRYFDVDSQRSIEKVKEIRVFPATEYIFTEEEIEEGLELIEKEAKAQLQVFNIEKKRRSKEDIDAGNAIRKLVADAKRTGDYSRFIKAFSSETVGFADYLPKGKTLIVLDELHRLKEKSDLVSYEYEESMKHRLSCGMVLPCQTSLIRPMDEIMAGLKDFKKLTLSALDYTYKLNKIDFSMNLETRTISSYNNSFEMLANDLAKYKKNKYSVVLVSSSRTRAKRIVDDLAGLEIESYYSDDFTKPIKQGTIMVTYGSLHAGFEYPLLKFVCISESDIFTDREKKRLKRKKEAKKNGNSIASFNDLNVGDYVVHETHGLGIYKGIEKIVVNDVEKDYVKIAYDGNSNLFLLATQLDRLQKYAAADVEKKPKLNKLNSVEWSKTKSKVKSAVEEVAKDLVELYATRSKIKGYEFTADTVWQQEFEEMFPYEETLDQLNAIDDTKKDMESPRVMDRLICGDVGYGKTEVAIRAAFKAVQDSKQVAYLVPTTVLCNQHFNNFKERLKDFPVTVEQLSSFKTSAQNKETVAKLKKGTVDIVIGTHRLLSKDVEFKDLGLLIIDEEQRFGVTHKEKIKKLKENIDVLTLSATPIPRTLHMSLVGIRDMSVLEEPPVDRIPIQTFVTEHNDEMIREAINRELARDGQVFYVYNKVKGIEDMAAHVESLVPDANVAIAHGQMDKRQLERIMTDFINHEIDVLVCTTIIETGMDISNCNTMIIEDADNFGLSTLYQLRGRVGRSNRTAFAFLLYKRDRMISEIAEKRLSAIKEFAGFGSGFKIAMKDLEIRGAGSVLGRSQHGHMAAVGYDLYCKMLNQAVNKLKGIKNEYDFETTIDLDVDAFIPSTYIRSEYQKLDAYKRIANIETMEELNDMEDELVDRYGELPAAAHNLTMIALIKAKAHKIGFIEIKGGLHNAIGESGNSQWFTNMSISPKSEIDVEALDEFLARFGGALAFSVRDANFRWKVTKRKFGNAREYLNGLNSLMDDFLENVVKK